MKYNESKSEKEKKASDEEELQQEDCKQAGQDVGLAYLKEFSSYLESGEEIAESDSAIDAALDVIKRYYDYRSTTIEYDCIHSKDKLYNDISSKEDEDSRSSIMLKTIYPYDYQSDELFENRCKISLDAACADIYCKMEIPKQVNKDSKTWTPYSLRENNIITTGRYSEWKSYITYSKVAKIIGLPRRCYEIYGEEILEYVVPCILLLKVIFETKKVGGKFWGLVRKIFERYDCNEIKSELDINEKNYILKKLSLDSIEDKKSPKIVVQRPSEEEISLLRNRLIDIQDRDLFEDKTESIQDAGITKISSKIEFSILFVPMIAAVCNYGKDNPFARNTKVGGEEKEYRFLRLGESDAITKRISRSYHFLNEYIKLKNVIEEKKEYNSEKYNFFFNSIMFWIVYFTRKEKLEKKEGYLVSQFYITESLMSYQLANSIMRRCCDVFKTYEEFKTFTKKYPRFEDILRKVCCFHSVFIKQDLINEFLEDCFAEYPRKENEMRHFLTQANIVIDHRKREYRMWERVNFTGVVCSDTMKHTLNNLNKRYVDNFFCEYKKAYDSIFNRLEEDDRSINSFLADLDRDIAEEKRRVDGIIVAGGKAKYITHSYIKKMCKELEGFWQNQLGEKERLIRNWVIKNIIL